MPRDRPAHAARWRALARILLIVALLVAANFVAREYIMSLEFDIEPSNEDAVRRTILASAALYAVLLAIPFVPGAEIGLGLIAMLGPRIALLVYLCTIVGLTLSFALGRLIPLAALGRLARDCHLDKIGHLLDDIAPLDKQEKLRFLIRKAPRRLVPFLLRYRYLALAVALNIPWNYVIGGGGGIALFAGVSRLFGWPAYLLTIALAVAPVPVAVMIFGPGLVAGP